YIQKILEYTSSDTCTILALRLVNNAWNECIREYGEDLWKRVCDNYKGGNSLLHKCVEKKGCMWMINILIEDKNKKNRYGETPLHCACMFNYTECVELLLEKGADKE